MPIKIFMAPVLAQMFLITGPLLGPDRHPLTPWTLQSKIALHSKHPGFPGWGFLMIKLLSPRGRQSSLFVGLQMEAPQATLGVD